MVTIYLLREKRLNYQQEAMVDIKVLGYMAMIAKNNDTYTE